MGESEVLFKEILGQVGIIVNSGTFKNIHNFTLEEYLNNRKTFAQTCRKNADHIEEVVRDTGIAKTTGGAVGIVSGGAAIAGIFLAPFTAGASLALTVGGIAGGVASAGTSVTASFLQDGIVKSDRKKIEEALKTFESQEKVISELFQSMQKNLEKLRELMKNPSVLNEVVQYGKGIKTIGYNIVYKGVSVVQTINAVKFAKSVATFIQADFYAMAGIAEGMAAPGIGLSRIFGRSLIVAGSTTAKLLSGAMAVVGIGFGIYDVVSGAMDISGSKVADAYRKFARDYENETSNLTKIISEVQNVGSM